MLKRKTKKSEGGQALVEFMMMMPFLLTFIWYMIHVSSAINKSIVGQKHTRSHVFLKMYNHRNGPALGDFKDIQRSHFFIGVGNDIIDGERGSPLAPVEILGVGAKPSPVSGADNDIGEAKSGVMRQNIRIRTAFGICTQRKTLPDGITKTDFCGSKSSGGP